jgi:Flp pilus assembly protein TadD/phage FluMu protein Com
MTTTKTIVCQKCQAIFKFDPSKITTEVVKFKCPRCSLVQIIKRSDPQEELSSSPPTSQPETQTDTRITEDVAQEAEPQATGEAAEEHRMTEDLPQEAEPQATGEAGEEHRMTEDLPQEAESQITEDAEEVSAVHKPITSGEEAVAADPELSQFADNGRSQLAESTNNMSSREPSAAESEEPLIKLLQAEAHNLQGETLLSKNLYTQAIKDFSLALEISPNYVEALINRGSAYAMLDMLNDALTDFTHALEFEKNDAEIYNKRGEIYLQNSIYDRAIKDFTSALILNPMFGAAYLNRGRAYSEKGMSDEAMMDYNQAIRSDFENSSSSFAGQASPIIFFDEENAGNEEETAKFNQQGLVDLKNGEFEKAVENFTQAIHLSSHNADSYIKRGVAYLKLVQPDKALADFDKAVLFEPLKASLYYWRAQAWKAKNDSFNMNEDLKRSCELGYEPACIEYKKHKPSRK